MHTYVDTYGVVGDAAPLPGREHVGSDAFLEAMFPTNHQFVAKLVPILC